MEEKQITWRLSHCDDASFSTLSLSLFTRREVFFCILLFSPRGFLLPVEKVFCLSCLVASNRLFKQQSLLLPSNCHNRYHQSGELNFSHLNSPLIPFFMCVQAQFTRVNLSVCLAVYSISLATCVHESRRRFSNSLDRAARTTRRVKQKMII